MTSLVRNQHVYPGKSISRFCNPNGMVCLNLLTHSLVRPAHPNDKVFTENKSWDQRAEQGYGLKIEDRFQDLVENVISLKRYFRSRSNDRVFTEFYALWLVRSRVSIGTTLYENVRFRGVGGNPLSPKRKMEIELEHGTYFEDGSMPLRFLVGGWMQREVDFFVEKNKNLEWNFCQSKKLEFLVSDNPYKKIIPISPEFCLSIYHGDKVLTEKQVRELNIDLIVNSKKYYFARSINECIFCTSG